MIRFTRTTAATMLLSALAVPVHSMPAVASEPSRLFATGVLTATGHPAARLAWTGGNSAPRTLRMLAGMVAPQSPTNGVLVYAGESSNVTTGALSAGTTYSFSLFEDGAETGTLVTAQLLGTVLTARSSVSRVKCCAGVVTFEAILSDGSERPLPLQRLRVYRRQTGTLPWQQLPDVTTAADGRASVRIVTSRSTDVLLRYAGKAGLMPAQAVTGVTVVARVTAVLSPATVRRGTTVTVTGAVPVSQPWTGLAVQVLTPRGWQTIAGGGSSRTDGRFTFRVAPTVFTNPGRYAIHVHRQARGGVAVGVSATVWLTVT